MTYADLDINQRINLKGVLQDWAKYSVQDFQVSLDKKLYSKRVKNPRRTGNLRSSWFAHVSGSRVVLDFLLYGRFQDMGVGRGVTATDRIVNRQLGLGSTGRVRRPWYAKQKGYEIHRLRELLVARHLTISTDWLESALSMHLTRIV